MTDSKKQVCPHCKSPKFHITGVFGAIVACQCEHCFNAFSIIGEWASIRLNDRIGVRRIGIDDI